MIDADARRLLRASNDTLQSTQISMLGEEEEECLGVDEAVNRFDLLWSM